MSNRSNGQAGAHGCPFLLRAWMLAVLVVISLGASDTARADTIILKSGERIDGAIVDATRNTVVIRRVIGGMRQMSIQDIAEVRIELAQGEEIAGQLLGWVEGIHEVRSGREVIRIGEGGILGRQTREEPTGQSPPELPRRRAEEPTITTASPPAAPAARDAALQIEDSKSRPVAVKASVDSTGADAQGIVFRIELSRPAEQTVMLIYGTLNGTAKAGRDFEPQQGVMTLAPGTTSTEVYVPLIEHAPSTGDRQFELFLTADPEVAEVADKRITATIRGDG